MNLPKALLKERLADRYTAAELADAIELDATLFLDYFLDEVLEYSEILGVLELVEMEDDGE